MATESLLCFQVLYIELFLPTSTKLARTIKNQAKRQLFHFGRSTARRLHRNRPVHVGWVTANTLTTNTPELLGHLGSVPDMRISNIAHWINKNSGLIWNEIYDPAQSYDLVIFVKAMDTACQKEIRRIRASGGKVIFDANVNYYEIWGTYDVEGTRPTTQQQKDAIWMTKNADLVVADSTYLQQIAEKHNSRVRWIPDNVHLQTFMRTNQRRGTSPTRLVWSGVAKKAQPLLSLADVLASLEDVELLLVSDILPEVMSELENALPCRFVPYTNRRYARTLQTCHIIISPKHLVNGYEMGHTEYKITLGMAAGLPAVASPQQSYQEAIEHKGGGIIADTRGEWHDALQKLCSDPDLRTQMGLAAQRTVEEHYATPVVARRYMEALEELL